MNLKNLAEHLTSMGLALTHSELDGFRWKTAPAYNLKIAPINHFKNIKDVENHWRKIARERLQEIEAISQIGRQIAVSDVEIQELLDWAECRQLLSPCPLTQAIEIKSSLSVPKNWQQGIRRASTKYGCAAYTWFHGLIIDRVHDLRMEKNIFSASCQSMETDDEDSNREDR